MSSPPLPLRLRMLLARPAHVGVDLRRLDPSGGSGGIKPLLLHQVGTLIHSTPGWTWTLLAHPQLRAELQGLIRSGNCTVLDAARDSLEDPLPDVGWPSAPDVLFHPFPHWDPPAHPTAAWVALVVDTLHRELPDALPAPVVERRERLLQACLPRARAVVVISHAVAGCVERAFGSICPRIHVCQPVLPVAPEPAESVRLAAAAAGGARFAYYPANFWAHKNHAFLVEVWRRAGASAPALVCAGEPASGREALEDQWRRAGITVPLRLLPHQPEAVHRSLMRHAEAVVFPSLHEGWGMPVVEALRAGTPVLRTSEGALEEASLGLGRTPGDDPADWALALREVRRGAPPRSAEAAWRRMEFPSGLLLALLAARRQTR